MTPDDEAAWEAFYVNPDAVTFTRAEVRAAFMAGRESGRADAAAQALEQAANAAEAPTAGSDLDYWFGLISQDAGFREGLSDWLRARAAQYREKGKADE